MLNYKKYGKKRTDENKAATAALIQRAQRIARNRYRQEEPAKGGANHENNERLSQDHI